MKRLGEILTELEWVSPNGLAKALATQEVLGGRLGTCMLEVSAISEERLMAGLVRQLQVPAARIRDLVGVPSEVLRFFPESLAIESQAVPFRMLGDQLHVALLDVHDQVLLQALAERTEKQIVPHIANEARLFHALADGYGCPVSERFRQLVLQLEGQAVEGQADTGGGPREAEAEALVDGAERESVVRDIAQLAQELAGAQDRDSIATLVLRYLSKRYSTCALFICRRDEFRGWRGAGPGFDARKLSSLKLSVDSPSALASLKNGARYHAGPLTPNEAHKRIAAVWDGEVPRDALVVPARVGGRLALAIWCVPREVGSLDSAAIEEAERLAELTGDALARLIESQREPSSSTAD